MATYKCKNFGSCSLADGGKDFSVAAGGDDRCPECGMTLAPLAEGSGSGGIKGASKRMPLVIGGVALLLVVVGGYSWWRGNQVVVLTREANAPVASPASAASSKSAEAAAPPSALPAPTNVETKPASREPSELSVAETSARVTCDEATRAKQPDAGKICRRASAITLLNSGAHAAIAGNLDQAEKDYLAAKDKDPDIAELYFNLAVLKARQGKGSEAVDNLVLASSKGFRRHDLVNSEPALAKLKSDAVLKAKMDELQKK